MAYLARRPFNRHDSMEIYSVYTAESQRNKGYGRAIVQEATRHALRSVATVYYQVEVPNEPSTRIAESLGYQKSHESFLYVGVRKAAT